MIDHLDHIVAAQKNGKSSGLASICSAHPLVIEAALRHGLALQTPVLIEATCNQVNQYGGYTGLTPANFIRFVNGIANQVGFPTQNLILGGDHLGPLVWAREPAGAAMEKAKALVRAYAEAGFTKIHLDCSMPCADDRELPVELVAQRAAELAKTVEEATLSRGTMPVFPKPHYVIGTEVPPAGGAKAGDHELSITNPVDAAQVIDLTCRAFSRFGLSSAWERVNALVVQPGVEFGDQTVHDYDRPLAQRLTQFIESVPGMVYEAHSTDYQTRTALRGLVEDHFAILKVGPWLTFALREAVVALAHIEEILTGRETSHISEILETEMLQNPENWKKHYGGSPHQQRISRLFSFSDRVRYYWHLPAVQTSFNRMMENLGDRPLPLSLISQYMPEQYQSVREALIPNHPRALLLGRVASVLDEYAFACGIKV